MFKAEENDEVEEGAKKNTETHESHEEHMKHLAGTSNTSVWFLLLANSKTNHASELALLKNATSFSI